MMLKSHQSVAILVLSMLVLSSTAQAQVSVNCGHRESTHNGEVDFGSGSHSVGTPAGSGSVRWRFTAANDELVVTSRVQGTLFLDKIGSGCARLRVNFQDSSGNNLQSTQDIAFCGPGFNANSSANKRSIDVTSGGNAGLAKVQLTLGQGPTLGSIIDLETGSVRVPSTQLKFADKINNGNADFGGNSHSGGGPSTDAFIDLSVSGNGLVAGRVDGVLYWDALVGAGSARIITDFQNSAGATLKSLRRRVNGTGGDANSAPNKVGVLHIFQSPSMSKIRLRVGKVLSSGSFVEVASKVYSFGCT
jgi:hypothetical protein